VKKKFAGRDHEHGLAPMVMEPIHTQQPLTPNQLPPTTPTRLRNRSTMAPPKIYNYTPQEKAKDNPTTKPTSNTPTRNHQSPNYLIPNHTLILLIPPNLPHPINTIQLPP
jgi:hypothetical protein